MCVCVTKKKDCVPSKDKIKEERTEKRNMSGVNGRVFFSGKIHHITVEQEKNVPQLPQQIADSN